MPPRTRSSAKQNANPQTDLSLVAAAAVPGLSRQSKQTTKLAANTSSVTPQKASTKPAPKEHVDVAADSRPPPTSTTGGDDGSGNDDATSEERTDTTSRRPRTSAFDVFAAPPRPKAWEVVDLKTRKQWDMGNTPQEYFEWLPERLQMFLNGEETDDKGSSYWKGLADFLRSKQSLGNPAAGVALQSPPSKRDTKKGTKKAKDVSGWHLDNEWKAQRVLGAGTFGKVGLWVKSNEENKTIDEMAVKDAKWLEGFMWPSEDGRLSKEAVVHHHMNTSEIEHFVQLRAFRSLLPGFPGNNGMQADKNENRRWRTYLEYSPYGDLARLMDRYRAWNTYLPEAFIWHVFDSLAAAAIAFDEHPIDMKRIPALRKKDKATYKTGYKVLHLDIKPDNIFLGYEQPFDEHAKKFGGVATADGLTTTPYPMIKLGDFGVSEFMGVDDDPDNPQALWDVGTNFYKAPEMVHYGVLWREPPNGTPPELGPLQDHMGRVRDVLSALERPDEPWMKFTQALNIWNVGKVMYDLATLGRPWSNAKLSTRQERKYKEWHNNAIPNFSKGPFKQVNDAERSDGQAPCPYSNEVMKLVKKCMRPRMIDRISAQELKEATQTQLHYCLQTLTEIGEDFEAGTGSSAINLPKVYYNANEINDMEAGLENFKTCDGSERPDGERIGVAEDDVEKLLGAAMDPDWPQLKLPPQKGKQKGWPSKIRQWQVKKANKTPNSYWVDYCSVDGDKIRFTEPESELSSQPGSSDGSDSLSSDDTEDGGSVESSGDEVSETDTSASISGDELSSVASSITGSEAENMETPMATESGDKPASEGAEHSSVTDSASEAERSYSSTKRARETHQSEDGESSDTHKRPRTRSPEVNEADPHASSTTDVADTSPRTTTALPDNTDLTSQPSVEQTVEDAGTGVLKALESGTIPAALNSASNETTVAPVEASNNSGKRTGAPDDDDADSGPAEKKAKKSEDEVAAEAKATPAKSKTVAKARKAGKVAPAAVQTEAHTNIVPTRRSTRRNAGKPPTRLDEAE